MPDDRSDMLLTDAEWRDLAVICRVYERNSIGWRDEEVRRRVALCKRVMEAAE